jgi:hypothetical protein
LAQPDSSTCESTKAQFWSVKKITVLLCCSRVPSCGHVFFSCTDTSKKKNCLHRFFSALSTSLAAATLVLSPSSWVLLRLLQVLSQCCDVRCFSMAPTIVTGFLTCIYACADFDFGSSSRASFPTRRLLRLLLGEDYYIHDLA